MEHDGDFIENGLFGIADAPWLPTYIDIRANPDPYYQRFGFGQLEVPSDCPRTSLLMGWMETMFDERFAYRYLNRETLEQWQTSLQSNFDRRVHTLENSLMLYDRHRESLAEVFHVDKVTRKLNSTTDRDIDVTGTDSYDSSSTGTVEGDNVNTENGTTTRNDTPDSAVNANDLYNNGVTKTDTMGTEAHTENTTGTRTDSSTTNRKTKDGKVDSLTETVEHDNIDNPAKQIDEAIRMWRDLGAEFVGGFENNFLNILWC